MRTDSRLSRMLHILLHMARSDRPFTSEQIANMLNTNPVVVRRTMAGLKRAGYVTSEKGHGGGWSIGCSLENITLLDVHKAVGGPNIFAIGNVNPAPTCAVERVVNQALSSALEKAEALLLARLGDVTLAELAIGFDAICIADGWSSSASASQNEAPTPKAQTSTHVPTAKRRSHARSQAKLKLGTS